MICRNLVDAVSLYKESGKSNDIGVKAEYEFVVLGDVFDSNEQPEEEEEENVDVHDGGHHEDSGASSNDHGGSSMPSSSEGGHGEEEEDEGHSVTKYPSSPLASLYYQS